MIALASLRRHIAQCRQAPLLRLATISEHGVKMNCMMDVQRLRLLRELAARGTVAAVAKACWLTPSAVSQQLSVLEREAGTKLLERHGRRLRLTDAGERLVHHAELIIAELERAQADLAAFGSGMVGTIRLAAFPTIGRALVPQVLDRCRKDHPELTVTVDEQESHESIPALRAGEIDVALVYDYDLLPSNEDNSLELTPLFRDPILVSLSPDHPALAAEVPLAKLRDDPWIVPRTETVCHAAVLQACALAGFSPRIDFVTSDYSVTLALVAAGMGVALIPRLALAPVVTTAEVRPIAEVPLERRISVAVRAGSGSRPDIAALVAVLVGTAQSCAPST